MSLQKQPKPQKRAGYWYLIRRVPQEYAHLDRRSFVRVSTGIKVIDDPRGIAARSAVDKLNKSIEAYWKALRAGDAVAVAPFEEIRQLARRRGFEYKPVEEVAAAPLNELLARIESLLVGDRIDDPIEVAAVLGGAGKPPGLMLSGLFKEFEATQKGSLEGMSETQKRKWPAQYERAIKNMIALVGDKEIAELTRNDALELRKHWQDRIVAEGVNVSSANRDIGAMSKMIRTVSDTNGLGLTNVFDRLRITGMVKGQRKPFEAEHVQKVLFAEGQFDELNDEARHLIYLIAETGLRPSEAANLTRDTIRLGGAVPHVQVRSDGRVLKAKSSHRDIPLVGVALEVMKLHPNGFPRYRDNADALSALVNKYERSRPARAGAKPVQPAPLFRGSPDGRGSPGEGRGLSDGALVAPSEIRRGTEA